MSTTDSPSTEDSKTDPLRLDDSNPSSSPDSVVEVVRNTSRNSRLENLVVPIWKKKKYAKNTNQANIPAGSMSRVITSPLPPPPDYKDFIKNNNSNKNANKVASTSVSTPDVRVHNSNMFVVSTCPITHNASLYKNAEMANSITDFSEHEVTERSLKTMRSDSYVKHAFLMHESSIRISLFQSFGIRIHTHPHKVAIFRNFIKTCFF